MNSAQDVLNGGLLTPFTVARPSPPTTKEGAAAQREEKLKEQERAAAGRRMATQSLEETKRAQRRQLEGAEAYRTRQLMEIEGERPLPVSLPEFQSPRKTGEEMIGLLLVNAFATSALGKQNYLAAANAMTGAIRGYEAGKKTEYEQALKDFDVAVRKAVQEDKVNTAKYLQTANSKKMSVQDKFNLMRQDALRLDDKIMAAQLNTQQWDKVVAEIDRRLTAIDNTEREINREERRRVERAEERAQRRADRALDRADRAAEKEPKLYMATGPDGKPAMVRVTVDESGVAKAPEGYTLTGEAAGRRGRGAEPGQNARTFASRVFGNIQNAGQDLKNIAALPATSTTPILSGLINADPNTITGSLVSAGARRITDQEKRAFDQLSQQLGAALSRIEGQGLASASTKQTIQTFDALRPKAGDSAINMALYLAKVKQEIETGISVHEEMFGATQGQMNKNKKMSEDLDKLIPFNVDTVIDVVRKNRIPLSDSSMRLLRAAPIAQNIQYMGMRPTENVDRVSGQPSAPSGPAASRAPEGVPQEVWNAMTPQERALWPR